MKRQVVFGLFLCLGNSAFLYAQWTAEDSVRLQNILSGKEELKLNPETMKAIQSGSLIRTEEMESELLLAPGESFRPILKDFSEYISVEDSTADNRQRKIPYNEMPPEILMYYGPQAHTLQERLASFRLSNDIRSKGKKPSGISFDEALQYVFSPKFRQKKKNAKRLQQFSY